MAESNVCASTEPDQRQRESMEFEEEDVPLDRRGCEELTKLELDELEEICQKQYECEVSYEGIQAFKWQFDDCTKNPKHVDFFLEKEFIRQGPSCLPEGYKDESTFNFIKSQATLAVKLIVYCISEGRPVGYPLEKWKGRMNISFPGSGTVVNVKEQTVEDGQLCPCSECKSDSTVCNSKRLFTLEVRTARHVVYDKMEADKTSLYLSDFTEEKETEVTLSHGIHSLVDSDQSALSFTTHDTHLCDRLIEALKAITISREDVARLFHKDGGKPFLPIVSYPHGLEKRLSFGFIKEITGKGEVEYNTPTCPGSSGAAIFNPFELDVYAYVLYYHHEGLNRITGNNLSGGTVSHFDFLNSEPGAANLIPEGEDTRLRLGAAAKDRRKTIEKQLLQALKDMRKGKRPRSEDKDPEIDDRAKRFWFENAWLNAKQQDEEKRLRDRKQAIDVGDSFPSDRRWLIREQENAWLRKKKQEIDDNDKARLDRMHERGFVAAFDRREDPWPAGEDRDSDDSDFVEAYMTALRRQSKAGSKVNSDDVPDDVSDVNSDDVSDDDSDDVHGYKAGFGFLIIIIIGVIYMYFYQRPT